MIVKVFLAIGNKSIEEEIGKVKDIEIIDKEDNLELVKEIIEHMEIDYLILNSFLDESGGLLIDIAKLAKEKGIKVVVLIPEKKKFDEKKLIASLVSKGVYAFININELTEDSISKVVKNYPKEFNFNELGEPQIKVIEKEKIIERKIIKNTVIRNQIITCYSPDDALLSAEVSSQVAVMIAKETQQSVILLDFDNINPMIDHFLCIDKRLPVNDKYDIDSKTSLVALINAINRKRLTNNIFKELVVNVPKYKLSVVTGLYDLVLDDKVSKEHYEQIIVTAASMYDVVIINTNPFIKSTPTFTSLLKSTKVIAVVKDNYTSIRNLATQFNLLKSKVNRERVFVGVIKNKKFGIKENILSELLQDYKFAGYLESSELVDRALNEQIVYLDIANDEIVNSYKNIIRSLGFHIEVKIKNKGILSRFGRRKDE